MKIKHVILENGDLLNGLPAGLHDHQLIEATRQFAAVKSGFNLYKSRGYKFCVGASVYSDVGAAQRGRTQNGNYKGSFELTFNPTTKALTASGTGLQSYSDTTRVYALSVEGRQLHLEPYCSLEDAREDVRENGGAVVELRVSQNGGLVSARVVG